MGAILSKIMLYNDKINPEDIPQYTPFSGMQEFQILSSSEKSNKQILQTNIYVMKKQ
jgi:hypothetical protein